LPTFTTWTVMSVAAVCLLVLFYLMGLWEDIPRALPMLKAERAKVVNCMMKTFVVLKNSQKRM